MTTNDMATRKDHRNNAGCVPFGCDYGHHYAGCEYAQTIRQSTRGTADVTITLTGAEAEIALAALKFVSHLATGEGDDKDTVATAEVLDVYHSIGEQVYGAPVGLARWASAVVDALADQLGADVLAIIHRNYKQTKDGLSER